MKIAIAVVIGLVLLGLLGKTLLTLLGNTLKAIFKKIFEAFEHYYNEHR